MSADRAEGRAAGSARGVTPVYLTAFAIASCGLVYELVAGALASYLLGDSVTQFSLVIGVYLSSLGLGAFLSRYVVRGVARRFVDAEIAVALIGGLSAPALFFAFSSPRWFPPVFYAVVVLIGTIVGLEIPLLMRLLKDAVEFRDLVSQVLTFDYLGSLAASLLFPLVLLPRLGLTRTSVLFGLVNVAVAFWSLHLFRDRIGSPAGLYVRASLTAALLVAAFVLADHLTAAAEETQYVDEVIVAKTTAYQRIVVTKNRAGFQLFLNGHLQFSSVDEYRYHEALVHPAFAAAGGRGRRVAVLGGGDGLAVREVLKHPEVESVTLVDLDPGMTALARTHPLFVELNGGSLASPKVRIVNDDAMVWIAASKDLFDVVIVDFPDPNSYAVGKLYTSRFYTLLARRLDPEGVVSVQSTSPLFARRSFWIVDATLRAAGFATKAYHVAVPSFGEWGFVLAAKKPFTVASRGLPDGLRALSAQLLPTLFVFGPDTGPVDSPVNRLNDQVLVRTYEREWKRFD
ncbi:MAG TPA: polyamine aminopropyltransferase [Thermoanaerobaculia bacterium]|nr:polyamine aminopropyltransferase [Thermoanaerobaculia bacterium]